MFPIWNCVGCQGLTASKELIFCLKCQAEIKDCLNPRGDLQRDCSGMPLLALGNYDGLWAKWIKDIKRRARGFVLDEERKFLELLTEYYFCDQDFSHIDAIVPVPSHPVRVFFETDLSFLFSLALSKTLKIPTVSILGTSHKWVFQNKHSQKDRLNGSLRWKVVNEGKFRIKSAGPHQRVLLVDDVSTSGATVTAARLFLKQHQIQTQGAVVLASAL